MSRIVDPYFIPARDPREHNVAKHIREVGQVIKQGCDDDHVSTQMLESKLAAVEKELAVLKNAKYVDDLVAVFSAGGAVMLENSVDAPTAFMIEKDTTLDLNGKKISISEDTEGEGVFHVTGGSLVIDGSGCIDGVGKNDYNMALWADGGNVVINGGTFTNEGATATDDPSHFDLIYTKNGSIVEINGGFFRCATPKWTLNKNDKTESEIIVKGGTFVDYDPSHSETENPVANFVAEGFKVVAEPQENGEVWYTVVAAE